MSDDTATASASVDEIFSAATETLEQLKTSVVCLQKTIDEMKSTPDFEEVDVQQLQLALTNRAQQFQTLHSRVATMLQLYRCDITNIEARIQRKVECLQDIDKRLGTISGENSVRDHFVQQIGSLKRTLNACKQLLSKCIYDQMHMFIKPAQTDPPASSRRQNPSRLREKTSELN